MASSIIPSRELLRSAVANRSVKSVLTNKDGIEVSIPNIIVAIVVSLVVIASVVAGIVFIVPFAQNSQAQGDLQTVQSAEQLYYAQAAPPSFGTGAQLTAAKSVLKSNKPIGITVTGGEYCAASLSATGKVYYATSLSSVITDTRPTTPACPALTAINAVGFGDLN